MNTVAEMVGKGEPKVFLTLGATLAVACKLMISGAEGAGKVVVEGPVEGASPGGAFGGCVEDSEQLGGGAEGEGGGIEGESDGGGVEFEFDGGKRDRHGTAVD